MLKMLHLLGKLWVAEQGSPGSWRGKRAWKGPHVSVSAVEVGCLQGVKLTSSGPRYLLLEYQGSYIHLTVGCHLE